MPEIVKIGVHEEVVFESKRQYVDFKHPLFNRLQGGKPYGDFSDATPSSFKDAWISRALRPFLDQLDTAVASFRGDIEAVEARTADLKEEARPERFLKALKPPATKLSRMISKEFAKRQKATEEVQNVILAYSAPPPLESSEAVRAEIRAGEIRVMLRRFREPRREAEIREAAISRGDLSWVHAALDSPDPLIDPKTLEDFRRQLAFEALPWLEDKERDFKALETAVADVTYSVFQFLRLEAQRLNLDGKGLAGGAMPTIEEFAGLKSMSEFGTPLIERPRATIGSPVP